MLRRVRGTVTVFIPRWRSQAKVRPCYSTDGHRPTGPLPMATLCASPLQAGCVRKGKGLGPQFALTAFPLSRCSIRDRQRQSGKQNALSRGAGVQSQCKPRDQEARATQALCRELCPHHSNPCHPQRELRVPLTRVGFHIGICCTSQRGTSPAPCRQCGYLTDT